jgi:GDP-L-fucose synthase
MNKHAKVFVAGHRGMVGSAIVRALSAQGHDDVVVKTRAELDLRSKSDVEAFFQRERPQYVFLAAAKVGGIMANNTQPVEFLVENVEIQNNVLTAANRADVEKVLFLGSSCIYPKFAENPIREDSLMTGHLEPTNDAYAIAKITGIMLCQALRREYGRHYISAMPTNLYGPNDNYDLEKSHVLPALIRKFHTAKTTGAPEVVLWGTGTPRREFLHVDDLADACLFLMDNYDDPAPINVGTGVDLPIAELAGIVREIVGYDGAVRFDTNKPDGTPRKLLDVSRLSQLGWKARTALPEGIAQVYRDVDKSTW